MFKITASVNGLPRYCFPKIVGMSLFLLEKNKRKKNNKRKNANMSIKTVLWGWVGKFIFRKKCEKRWGKIANTVLYLGGEKRAFSSTLSVLQIFPCQVLVKKSIKALQDIWGFGRHGVKSKNHLLGRKRSVWKRVSKMLFIICDPQK